MIRLRQTKAANPFARRQLRQVFLSLGFTAKSIDRIHDEARLYAHCRAIAAVDTLYLTRNQTVRDIVDPGAAVTFDRRAEKAECSHFVHDLAIKPLVSVGFEYARQKL